MQDGYYFATTPWMIGDAPLAPADQTGITVVEDHSGLRRGQIVRIAAEPQQDVIRAVEPDHSADAPVSPIILRETDRFTGDSARPDSRIIDHDSAYPGDAVAGLLSEFMAHQTGVLARIDSAFCDSITKLEDRVVAALAANMELTRPQSAQSERLDAVLGNIAQDGQAQTAAIHALGQEFAALSAKVDAMPRHSETLLRDVADIRTGLTELRVQARLIEMQLFAISRGTDNPLARPMGIEPLGAMLADTYAS